MNKLALDIGRVSINHYGETLCGDSSAETVAKDGSEIIVLADGLKSGVKASILSTLTSKIISTMLSEGMTLESCVSTVAQTLPISSEYGVAYSTFSIIRVMNGTTAEIIEYENPRVILIRDNEVSDFPTRDVVMAGKKILRSTIRLQEGDTFVMMSDGCPGANDKLKYDKEWDEHAIGEFISALTYAGYNAKELAQMLIEECDNRYAHKPIDDCTVCIVRVLKRQSANILFGPPSSCDDGSRVTDLFMSKSGIKIVCGGSTSAMLAHELGDIPVTSCDRYSKLEGPPMSEIEGIDYVTEGLLTMNKLLDYTTRLISGEMTAAETDNDAAAVLLRVLLEEATDVNIFVGLAFNPAHSFGTNFNLKKDIAEKLAANLRIMGKNVKVSCF